MLVTIISTEMGNFTFFFQAYKRFLVENTSLDLNAIEPSLSKAPIHSILIGQPQERSKFLEVLLIYGSVDVNLPDLDGMSPLHLAVKVI